MKLESIKEQYKNTNNLETRIDIYRFSTAELTLHHKKRIEAKGYFRVTSEPGMCLCRK